jgi:hypothetical protein
VHQRPSSHDDRVTLSRAFNPAPPRPGDLRRRAWLVFAAILVTDLLLVLGMWGDGFGLAGPIRRMLLAAGLIVGLLVIVVGLEPFRRWELRFAEKAEPETVHGWQVALFALGPLAACIPLWHFLSGEPWRLSIARSVGLGVYFAFFYVLRRLQRRGVEPYLRPAWYGFFLAGITASLIWSVVAGRDVMDSLGTGIAGPLLHYGYVRCATRFSAGDAKRDGSTS